MGLCLVYAVGHSAHVCPVSDLSSARLLLESPADGLRVEFADRDTCVVVYGCNNAAMSRNIRSSALERCLGVSIDRVWRLT